MTILGNDDLEAISMSSTKHVSITKDELAELVMSLEQITLQCQRLSHKIERLSVKFIRPERGDEKNVS